MLQTIKGKVSFINADTVTKGDKSWNVLRINVKTKRRTTGKGSAGNHATIEQVNLTVFDKDLIDSITAANDYDGDEPIVVGDFVEVLMGDAIVNGGYINGQAHDVVWIEEHEYQAPEHYRDVDNAPSGKLERPEVKQMSEEE